MEDIHARLDAWTEDMRSEVWQRWLWGSDCNAPPLERCCDMNEMHMLGVLVCLGEYARPVPMYHDAICAETVGGPDMIHLQPHMPVKMLSLRETLDQLECLQLNWGPALSECGHNTALEMLRALMARLGEMVQHAYPIVGDSQQQVLDDPQHVTPLPGGAGLGVVSRKSLRHAVCVLLALVRVHHIVSRSEDVPEATDGEINVVVDAMRQHHIESSMDCYNDLQQMVHLAPGQRLAYRTTFCGMFNHVSQVVYFHHPRYCRMPQVDLDKIPESPLHMVPLAMQLVPEIIIVYDDDSRVPLLTTGVMASTADPSNVNPKGPQWCWLVCCGAFFVVDVERKRILGHERLAPLIAYYLRVTGGTVSAAETTGVVTARGQACTPFCHVQLL